MNLIDLSLLVEYCTSKQSISIRQRKCVKSIYVNSLKILDQTLISTFDPHMIKIIGSEVDTCILIKIQTLSSPSFARMTFRPD